MISINKPMSLVAEGNETELRVQRTPLLDQHHQMFAPVLEHIQRYGLVLVETKASRDTGWYAHQVVTEVYAKP